MKNMTMINLSEKTEITTALSNNNAKFLKFQSIKAKDGFFRRIHFVANTTSLAQVERAFGKQAIAKGGDLYFLELKREDRQWI